MPESLKGKFLGPDLSQAVTEELKPREQALSSPQSIRGSKGKGRMEMGGMGITHVGGPWCTFQCKEDPGRKMGISSQLALLRVGVLFKCSLGHWVPSPQQANSIPGLLH